MTLKVGPIEENGQACPADWSGTTSNSCVLRHGIVCLEITHTSPITTHRPIQTQGLLKRIDSTTNTSKTHFFGTPKNIVGKCASL
jgi:hypothetical protein